MEKRSTKSWLDGAWAALAVTLLVPLAVGAMPPIFLPTVDAEALAETARRLHLGSGQESSLGVFALGVLPFVSATVLVELAAFVVPPWARLRVGGPAGRAKLGRAAAVLAVILAAFQATGVAAQLAAMNGAQPISTPLVVVTLVAGSMLLGLVADFATRRGLVSGFLTLLAVSWILDTARESVRAGIVPGRIGVVITGGLASAAATWLLLRTRKPSVRLEPTKSPDPYRARDAADAARHLDVPLPAAGLVPLVVIGSVRPFVTMILQRVAPARAADSMRLDHLGPRAFTVLSTVVLAALFAWLLYRPRRVAELWRRAGSRIAVTDLESAVRALLRRSFLISLVYLAGLVALTTLVDLPDAGNAVLVGALLAALALDLVDAWRARRRHADLVAVWPEQRVYAIAVAAEALGAAGIPLFVRGERFRCLTPFAPLIPLDLMVPAADAERASAVLSTALGSSAPPARSEADVRAASESNRHNATWAIAAAVAVAATIAIPERGAAPTRSRGPVRPEAMRIFMLDDDANPFDARSSVGNGPECLELGTENVPVGPSRQVMRAFADCKPAGGAPIASARADLLAWAAGVKLPPGDRVLTGSIADYDAATDTTREVGVRTYLIKDTPILDGRDVASAELVVSMPEENRGAVVAIALEPDAAAKFERVTSENVGRRFAIVVDDFVTSAPRILSRIQGGHFQITMGAGDVEKQNAEAKRLVDALMGQSAEPR